MDKKTEALNPDCWVCVKDGKIIGFYDKPFTLAGVESVRYVHHKEVESLAIENIQLQNLVKDLDDWNDSLRARLSYREAYPANFTRAWEGLTEDERDDFWYRAGTVGWWEVLKMVEAKLKEKNA